MSWRRIAASELGASAYDVAPDGAGFVVRGFDRVVGWDGASGAPSWTVHLPNDDPFRCKRLARAADVFAVVEDPGGARAAELIGLTPDGAVAWRTPLGLAVERRGLAAAGGLIWATGGTGHGPQLVAVEATTGRVVERLPAVGDQLAAAGDALIVAGTTGLHVARGGALVRAFETVNAGELLVDGDDVVMYFEDPADGFAPTIGRFDARAGRVTATLVTPEDVEEGPCTPRARFGAGVAVSLGEGRGVALFDLDRGRILWRALIEGGGMVGPSAVSGGVLVCSLALAKAGRLAAVDLDGAPAPAPRSRAPDASTVLQLGADVLVGGARLLERFTWEG